MPRRRLASTTAKADWPERVRRAGLILLLLAVAAIEATTGHATPVSQPPTRVTVIGDSIATAIQYQSTAHSVLSRGVELDLQLAVCRRLVGDSCPYEGVRPPTLVALLPSLQLIGSTVVVAVGYNDYEQTFAESVETVLQALENAGAAHVLWLTLRAERQSYLNMNDVIRAAATRHPELTAVDWNLYSRSHPEWFQPDGLHLTDVGAIAMATLLHRSLDELGLVAAPAVQSLQIVTKRLPTARVGRPYATRLTASGGSRPFRWARTTGAIPVGLRLWRDGRLTGTPRIAGRRLITLRVMDLGGRSATRRFLLTITASARMPGGKPAA